MQYCRNCGNQIKDDENFCCLCGMAVMQKKENAQQNIENNAIDNVEANKINKEVSVTTDSNVIDDDISEAQNIIPQEFSNKAEKLVKNVGQYTNVAAKKLVEAAKVGAEHTKQLQQELKEQAEQRQQREQENTNINSLNKGVEVESGLSEETRDFFIDSSEKEIMTYRTHSFFSFISGYTNKVTLTDKRVYYDGKTTNLSVKLGTGNEYKEYTIDLEDIEHSGIVYRKNVVVRFLAIAVAVITVALAIIYWGYYDASETILSIGGCIDVVLWFMYIFGKTAYYEFGTASANIAFGIYSDSSIAEVRKFDKAVRISKDMLKRQNQH